MGKAHRGAAIIAACGPHGVFVLTPKAMRELDREIPFERIAQRGGRRFEQLSKKDQQKARRLFRAGKPYVQIGAAVRCYPGSIAVVASERGWNRGAK